VHISGEESAEKASPCSLEGVRSVMLSTQPVVDICRGKFLGRFMELFPDIIDFLEVFKSCGLTYKAGRPTVVFTFIHPHW